MYKMLTDNNTVITTYTEWDEFRRLIPFFIDENKTFNITDSHITDIDLLYEKLCFNNKMKISFELMLRKVFFDRKIVLTKLTTSYATQKGTFTHTGIIEGIADEIFNGILTNTCLTGITCIVFSSVHPNMPLDFLPHPAFFINYRFYVDAIRNDGERILALADRCVTIDSLLNEL